MSEPPRDTGRDTAGASKRRSNARPTRSSLIAAACPAASPSRPGPNRAAHSPSP